MKKSFGSDIDEDDEVKVDCTDVTEVRRSEVSNALDSRSVKDLLLKARNKSEEDDEKAVPAFEEGQTLFGEERYSDALLKYLEASLLGHLKAQRRLGIMYLEGLGCNQDYHLAMTWLKEASKRNDLHAQEHLARMYRHGLGVEANIKTAIGWYQRAREQDGTQSAFDLATCYLKGEGVTQNVDEALRLFMIAAERGHADARYQVGVAYANGLGVEQNEHEAIDWYILAIKGGNDDARAKLWAFADKGTYAPESAEEALFAEKVGLSVNDQVCQFKEALRLMAGYDGDPNFSYFEKVFKPVATGDLLDDWKDTIWSSFVAMKGGKFELSEYSYKLELMLNEEVSKNHKAQWLLTDFYRIERNSLGNFYCQLMLACNGDQDSQYIIGKEYYYSECIKRNVNLALFWLEKATTKQVELGANAALGQIYYYEEIGKNYKEKAVKYFKKGAKFGCSWATSNLSYCYLNGIGVKQNEEMYIKYLKRTANLEHTGAMIRLSKEFGSGGFLPKNPKLEQYWLKRAVKAGNCNAIFRMAELKEKLLKTDVNLWTEPDSDNHDRFKILDQRFFSKVDESSIWEVVQLYVSAADNGSRDAILRLIIMETSERLRNMSRGIRKLLCRHLERLLVNNKENLEETLRDLDSRIYNNYDPQNEFELEDSGDNYFLTLKEIRNNEVEKIKSWAEIVRVYTEKNKKDIRNRERAERTSRIGESRKRREQRLKEKRNKEQEFSNFWYD